MIFLAQTNAHSKLRALTLLAVEKVFALVTKPELRPARFGDVPLASFSISELHRAAHCAGRPIDGVAEIAFVDGAGVAEKRAYLREREAKVGATFRLKITFLTGLALLSDGDAFRRGQNKWFARGLRETVCKRDACEQDTLQRNNATERASQSVFIRYHFAVEASEACFRDTSG